MIVQFCQQGTNRRNYSSLNWLIYDAFRVNLIEERKAAATLAIGTRDLLYRSVSETSQTDP